MAKKKGRSSYRHLGKTAAMKAAQTRSRRNAQLVCQHLENVSGDVIADYPAIIRAYVRRRVGIYALYRKERLYYVGLAKNLRARLNHHLRDRHRGLWDRFSVYLTIDDRHLKELESLILRTIRPPGNRQKGKFARSQDLRRSLARDIKNFHHDELHRLIGKRTTPVDGSHPEDRESRFPLSRYISGALRLRAVFHGKKFRARVWRNGAIRFNGKFYPTPSAAAHRATRGSPMNGWTFWQCERAPGQWVTLDELRK